MMRHDNAGSCPTCPQLIAMVGQFYSVEISSKNTAAQPAQPPLYTCAHMYARTRVCARYTLVTLGNRGFPIESNELGAAQRHKKLWAGWAA